MATATPTCVFTWQAGELLFALTVEQGLCLRFGRKHSHAFLTLFPCRMTHRHTASLHASILPFEIPA